VKNALSVADIVRYDYDYAACALWELYEIRSAFKCVLQKCSL